MATLRQSAQSNFAGADPATATLASSPVEGNLLVLVATERSGNNASSYTTTGITGWTQEISRDVELANGTYRRNLIIWWKVAGASESTSVTVDNGTSSAKWVSIHEYEHVGVDEDQWSLLDSASNDNGTTSSATTIATGTTASQSGEMFIVAAGSVKRGNNTLSIGTVTFDSGLSTDTTYDPATSGDMAHIIGSDAKDTATGTKSSTMTLGASANNIGLTAGIIVFDVESGGGGGATVPIFMMNYRRRRS